MLRLFIFSFFLFASPLVSATSEEGLAFTSIESRYTVPGTVDRLKKILEARGLDIIADIDHQANAPQIGEELRATRLLLFGSPKIETRLIQCGQSMGLDLPMKYLVWKGPDGVVWVSHNKVTLLEQRHEMTGCGQILENLERELGVMAEEAAGE